MHCNSPGYRLVLKIRGRDYEHGLGDAQLPGDLFSMTGVGPFTHADPRTVQPPYSAAKTDFTSSRGRSHTFFCRSFREAWWKSNPQASNLGRVVAVANMRAP